MGTCSNQESKKFKCSECPYIVDHQDRLKTHQEKKHSIASKFQCTYYQNKVNKKDHLKVHEKTHLPPPGQNNEFSCDVCNKSFASKKSLYVHSHKFHKNSKASIKKNQRKIAM